MCIKSVLQMGGGGYNEKYKIEIKNENKKYNTNLGKFRRFFGFNSFIYQYFSKISTDLNSLLKTEENEV